MNPLGALGLVDLAGRILGGGAPRNRAAHAGSIDFEELLEKARGGAIEHGRPVVLGAEVAGLRLTPGQVAQLSRAADHAAANGEERIAVFMDGMVFYVDVASRTVTEVEEKDEG